MRLKSPYAIKRYVKETNRLYGVLERRITEREFVAGNTRLPTWPPTLDRSTPASGTKPRRLAEFEAVVRGDQGTPGDGAAYDKAKEVNPALGAPMSDAAKKVLFGQTAAVVR